MKKTYLNILFLLVLVSGINNQVFAESASKVIIQKSLKMQKVENKTETDLNTSDMDLDDSDSQASAVNTSDQESDLTDNDTDSDNSYNQADTANISNQESDQDDETETDSNDNDTNLDQKLNPNNKITSLKGSVQEEHFATDKPKEGILFFNDRLRIDPEITTDINSGINMRSPVGAGIRNRDNVSYTLIKENEDHFLSEGKFNFRLNMGAGYDPLKGNSMGLIDSIYADSGSPDTGVNIGKGLATKIGFIDVANYSQKFNIWKVEFNPIVGLTDLRDYFDKNAFAGETDTQFSNSSFMNNRVLESNITALTLMGVWSLKRPNISFKASISPLDPRSFTNVLASVGEFEYDPKIFGRQGHYRFGLGSDPLVDHIDNRHFHDDSEYLYFSVDQKIKKNLGIFFRFGDAGTNFATKFPFFIPVKAWSNHQDVHPVHFDFPWWIRKDDGFNGVSDYLLANNYGSNGIPVRQDLSCGFEWQEPFGYKKACISFGYAQNWRIFRSAPVDTEGHPVFAYASFPRRASEKIYEVDYRYKLNDHITLIPNVQMIFDGAGNKDNHMNFVFGIKTFWHLGKEYRPWQAQAI